jgi:hypothetical protein
VVRVTKEITTEVGDLLTTWVGIQMDTVDAMVADAQAKVDAIPDYRTLMLLIGELTVRMVWLETEIQRLKGVGDGLAVHRPHRPRRRRRRHRHHQGYCPCFSYSRLP